MINRGSKLLGALLMAGSLLFASPAWAPPPTKVAISNMADFLFGTWSGVGDVSLNNNVCAHRSTAGTYNVTASGDGIGGAFTLAHTLLAGQSLSYRVYWNDQANTVGRVELTANSALGAQATGGANKTCQGGSSLNANLSIEIEEVNMLSVAAGSYTGILTVLIGPD